MSVICIGKKRLNYLGYDDLVDWLKNPRHIYIGRNMSFYVKGAIQSKWANPFSVKKYGRKECLMLYKSYILLNKELCRDLPELIGKVLGCWCTPDPCHGDVLIELLKEISEK